MAQYVTESLMDHQEERQRQLPDPVILVIKPEVFHGYLSEDATRWLAQFVRYSELQEWTKAQQVSTLAPFSY